MITFQQYLTEKKNVDYDLSSTQVDLPSDIAKGVIAWCKFHIPEDDLYKEGDKFGRENEIHVTILYGLHTANPLEVKKIVKGNKPIKFTLGKISLFSSNSQYDVVKIDVEGQALHQLNKKLKKLKYTSSFPQYHPHITLAYVKKGMGKKHVGVSKFAGEVIISNDIIFSSKNGTKTKIEL